MRSLQRTVDICSITLQIKLLMSQLFSDLMTLVAPLVIITSPDPLISEIRAAVCMAFSPYWYISKEEQMRIIKLLVLRMQYPHYLHFRELALEEL